MAVEETSVVELPFVSAEFGFITTSLAAGFCLLCFKNETPILGSEETFVPLLSSSI